MGVTKSKPLMSFCSYQTNRGLIQLYRLRHLKMSHFIITQHFVQNAIVRVYLFCIFTASLNVSVCLTFVISFQQWWDSVITRKSYFAFLSYLPKILLAFVIPALDGVYSKIAFWLNDMGKSLTIQSNRVPLNMQKNSGP